MFVSCKCLVNERCSGCVSFCVVLLLVRTVGAFRARVLQVAIVHVLVRTGRQEEEEDSLSGSPPVKAPRSCRTFNCCCWSLVPVVVSSHFIVSYTLTVGEWPAHACVSNVFCVVPLWVSHLAPRLS